MGEKKKENSRKARRMKKRVVWGRCHHQKFQLHSNTIYSQQKMKKINEKIKLPVFGKKKKEKKTAEGSRLPP